MLLAPLDVLCSGDDPAELMPGTPGGVWEASCLGCLNTPGEIDPTQVAPGTLEVSYTIQGDCGEVTEVQEVQVGLTPNVNTGNVGALCPFSDPVQLRAHRVVDPGLPIAAAVSARMACLTRLWGLARLPRNTPLARCARRRVRSQSTLEKPWRPASRTWPTVNPSVPCNWTTMGWLAAGPPIAEDVSRLQARSRHRVPARMSSFMPGAGCGVESSATVTVDESLPIGSANVPEEMCVNAGILNLVADVDGGTWSSSGTGLNGAAFNPATAPLGTSVLSYTVENGSCTNSASFATAVRPFCR